LFWLIHVSGNGLATFDRKTNVLTHFSFREQMSPGDGVTGVTAILEDRNGNLWFGTRGAGLLRFDHEKRQFIAYRNDSSNPQSLAQDRITCLYEDGEGSIWVGLSGGAPNHFSSKRPLFTEIRQDVQNPSTSGEPFVTAIYEDDQGILWMGSRGALSRVNRK